MVQRLALFLIANFVALALGGLFTGPGVSSEWYQGLEQAPWTPLGWVFGAAWTSIMICFAFYMAYLWPKVADKRSLLFLFFLQWILNVAWNPVFFHYHAVNFAFMVISSLTLLLILMGYKYWGNLRAKSIFLFPYIIWLLIATSLNGYILMHN